MRPLPAPPRADAAIAAVLATYALVEGLLLVAPAGWIVPAVAVCVALAWRRSQPVPVIAAVVALITLPGLFSSEEVASVLPLPLIILAGYTAG